MLSYSRYHREIAAAKARIADCPSRVAETRHGPIEYLCFGEGPPLLLVHGVVGGCDQAPSVAAAFFGGGFRVVAVSRFGYVRSPLPTDPSPASQADRYAALLDDLGIDKVALVGTSAGTASSLQFAIRHPDRCAALILFSMAVPPYPVPPPLVLRILRAYFGSDLLFWSTLQLQRLRFRLLGVPSAFAERSKPEDQAFLSRLVSELAPGSVRVDGIINDIAVSNPSLEEPHPLEHIAVPTLVIHAMDDRWGPFRKAETIAARIPGVRFRPVESGGHLLLGHRETVGAEVAAFVREHTGASYPTRGRPIRSRHNSLNENNSRSLRG